VSISKRARIVEPRETLTSKGTKLGEASMSKEGNVAKLREVRAGKKSKRKNQIYKFFFLLYP
jgi:hypothetical protein